MLKKSLIRLVEVGPRDGLQNEKIMIPTKQKIQLISKLIDCRLPTIEATSFVSPKRIPQMADCQQVLDYFMHQNQKEKKFSCLVPNMKGYQSSLPYHSLLDSVAVFTGASESFTQKNISCSIQESLERFRPIFKSIKESGSPVKVRGYVSCVAGCPYEGKVDKDQVLRVTSELLEMGCYEVSLGDTIGTGTPKTLAIHCHDTYGQAIANITQCLEMGIITIDASIAGLGGCPYAKGASGNVATEDVLYLINGLGLETEGDLDLKEVVKVGHWFSTEVLKRPYASKAGLAVYNKFLQPE